jgi:hypothetical protein
MNEDVSPKDLDIVLPKKDFDPHRFVRALKPYGV